MDYTPFILSLKLAAFTVVLTLAVAMPLVYCVHFSKSKAVKLLAPLLNLPIILPPTVLGFYLLLAFRPNTWFSNLLDAVGIELAFSFSGLVLASVIFNLPFMIGPIQNGLDALPKRIEQSAFILGKSKFVTFHKVLLPNAFGSILTAIMLTVAHTIGAFGVILMIGGNIPGVTRVASIAIYSEVEAMNYGLAHNYAFILFAISVTLLLSINFIKGKLNYAAA